MLNGVFTWDFPDSGSLDHDYANSLPSNSNCGLVIEWDWVAGAGKNVEQPLIAKMDLWRSHCACIVGQLKLLNDIQPTSDLLCEHTICQHSRKQKL